MEPGKKAAIELWMRQSKTDVLAIQETHVGHCGREVGTRYTWFFAGASLGNHTTIAHGVAF
eukprot:7899973-Prorocentrum_lima.AAC.1